MPYDEKIAPYLGLREKYFHLAIANRVVADETYAGAIFGPPAWQMKHLVSGYDGTKKTEADRGSRSRSDNVPNSFFKEYPGRDPLRLYFDNGLRLFMSDEEKKWWNALVEQFNGSVTASSGTQQLQYINAAGNLVGSVPSSYKQMPPPTLERMKDYVRNRGGASQPPSAPASSMGSAAPGSAEATPAPGNKRARTTQREEDEDYDDGQGRRTRSSAGAKTTASWAQRAQSNEKMYAFLEEEEKAYASGDPDTLSAWKSKPVPMDAVGSILFTPMVSRADGGASPGGGTATGPGGVSSSIKNSEVRKLLEQVYHPSEKSIGLTAFKFSMPLMRQAIMTFLLDIVQRRQPSAAAAAAAATETNDSMPNLERTGLLMYGPPGVGKTFFVQRCAEEWPKDVGIFMSRKGQTLSRYIGDAEKNMKFIYDVASASVRQRARTVVGIFWDEIETIVPRRENVRPADDDDGEGAAEEDGVGSGSRTGGGDGGGGGGNDEHSSAINSVVTAFLELTEPTNMQPGVLTLAASNYPWKLDPAADARLANSFFVDLPDFKARCFTVLQTLRRVGLQAGVSFPVSWVGAIADITGLTLRGYYMLNAAKLTRPSADVERADILYASMYLNRRKPGAGDLPMPSDWYDRYFSPDGAVSSRWPAFDLSSERGARAFKEQAVVKGTRVAGAYSKEDVFNEQHVLYHESGQNFLQAINAFFLTVKASDNKQAAAFEMPYKDAAVDATAEDTMDIARAEARRIATMRKGVPDDVLLDLCEKIPRRALLLWSNADFGVSQRFIAVAVREAVTQVAYAKFMRVNKEAIGKGDFDKEAYKKVAFAHKSSDTDADGATCEIASDAELAKIFWNAIMAQLESYNTLEYIEMRYYAINGKQRPKRLIYKNIARLYRQRDALLKARMFPGPTTQDWSLEEIQKSKRYFQQQDQWAKCMYVRNFVKVDI